LSCLEQCILELAPFLDFHEHAIGRRARFTLMSHCIAQHPDAFAALCAEKQKYFLRPAVKLYERKEMRLIENPAADRKDCLEVPATKLTRFVSEARRERSVHIADLPIVTERDKSAWGMFEQIGVHVIRDNP